MLKMNLNICFISQRPEFFRCVCKIAGDY